MTNRACEALVGRVYTDEEFVHIWREAEGRLIELRKITDTARW